MSKMQEVERIPTGMRGAVFSRIYSSKIQRYRYLSSWNIYHHTCGIRAEYGSKRSSRSGQRLQ